MEETRIEQAERHQDERRSWHEASTADADEANVKHGRKISRIFWILALRPVIELAILVVLILHWFL